MMDNLNMTLPAKMAYLEQLRKLLECGRLDGRGFIDVSTRAVCVCNAIETELGIAPNQRPKLIPATEETIKELVNSMLNLLPENIDISEGSEAHSYVTDFVNRLARP